MSERASATSRGAWLSAWAVGRCLRRRHPAGDARSGSGRNMQRASRSANVRPVLGTFVDPKLPKDALDLVLLVDVYHEFSEPEKMLDRIRESLKPNWPSGVAGISRGRPESSDQARAQDDAETGAGRGAAGGLPLRSVDRGSAGTAHHRLPALAARGCVSAA